MKCSFCNKTFVKKHLCYKSYCYEYIFKQFFINIFLDFKPINSIEFYSCCQKRIIKLNMFKEVPNPFNILSDCLQIFLQEYECF